MEEMTKGDTQESQTPVDPKPASEFENFKNLLSKILSVRKDELDLHKPIRPRKGKRA